MSVLKFVNLSFKYEKENVLENVNLEIQEGKPLAIIGKNGSGKTTLLKCVFGADDYSGSILLDGKDIKSYSSKEFGRKIAYVPQEAQINIDYKVIDFILFGRTPHLKLFQDLSEKDYELAKMCASQCFASHLLNKDINKISGGERQLVYIARALCQESDIIIMDEPTASLDFGNQQKLFKLIKDLTKKGKTIIFTTHNPNYLSLLDCNVCLVANKTIKVVNNLDSKLLKEIYGEDFDFKNGVFTFKV